MIQITKGKLQKIVKKSLSWSDVQRALDLPINGTALKIVKNLIREYNIDFSHRDSTKASTQKNTKNPLINKKCPVCGIMFETRKGALREKRTCSYSCSNTLFRSGKENGMYGKATKYTTICFQCHNKICVIPTCGEERIIAVHHYDENKENNNPENLIPLCPTHHQYHHSRYAYLVDEHIEKYRNNYIKLLEKTI